MVSKRLFFLLLEIYCGDFGMGMMEKVVSNSMAVKPMGQALSL